MSKRAGEVPISFQSFGSLSFGSFGTSSFEAAAAILPYVVLFPDGCEITLLAALHSAAGTSHCFAAAATSISRALAPALRRYSCDSRMPRLPPVDIDPNMRLRRIWSFTSAYSGRTLLQSHSSSSATSCARPVKEPCPSSERAMRMTTMSFGWITIQCVTSGVPAASAACTTPDRLTPIMSPPETAAVLTRNSRRPDSKVCGFMSSSSGGLRDEMDRVSNARVGSAAADVRHRRVDLFVRGILRFLQQGGRSHDHAALAVSALRHLQLHPGFLQRVRTVLRQALDGGDLAGDGGRWHHTGTHRLAVDEHRARATHGDAATIFGSGHAQLVAQDPQQRHFVLDVHADLFSIHIESAHDLLLN